MKRIICNCDMCGAEYPPLNKSLSIPDWRISPTINGPVMMGAFDLCPECQIKLKEILARSLTVRYEIETREDEKQ